MREVGRASCDVMVAAGDADTGEARPSEPDVDNPAAGTGEAPSSSWPYRGVVRLARPLCIHTSLASREEQRRTGARRASAGLELLAPVPEAAADGSPPTAERGASAAGNSYRVWEPLVLDLRKMEPSVATGCHHHVKMGADKERKVKKKRKKTREGEQRHRSMTQAV